MLNKVATFPLLILIRKNIQNMTWEFNGGSSGKDLQSQIMAETNFQLFGNSDKALVVINEIDTLDLRTQQPLFRDFMEPPSGRIAPARA